MTPADRELWLQAQHHIAAHRWEPAKSGLATLLQRYPDAVSARLLLASLFLAEGKVRDSVEQLRFAAFALPDDAQAICRVAQSLAKLGETQAAFACLRHPEIARTRSAPALLALAHVQQGLGLHAEALALMERARGLGLDSADFRYFHALQLQFNGRIAEAEAGMESCLAMGPTFGRASLTLARVRRQTHASNHIDFIRTRLASVAPGTEDHAAFEFALHKELDDTGNFAEAWEALRRGNEVMHRRLGYDAEAEQALFDALIERFDSEIPSSGETQPRGSVPVFIVGMPRSGTTLLERILGNHSMVAPAGELADLPRQLRWTADRHGHALLDQELLGDVPRLDFALLGRRYLEQTQWRAQGRRFYVDKLPPNFMLVGCIRRALPQAKVLHMIRDPMDVCFSNYRALFGDSYAYSYDLDALAHHHGLYRRLMQHWHRVAPGFVLDIGYDELVRDTEGVARRVLGFCGLPYEADCVDTTRNTAPVSTLSSAQVRAPIHQRALGEWRRYEAQLEPLRQSLTRS